MTRAYCYVGSYTHDEQTLYIQGGGKGISVFSFDMATGMLELVQMVEALNPSFLVGSGQRHLYAVNETAESQGAPTGSVAAFAVDASTGKLSMLNDRTSGGIGPCQIGLHPDARFLGVANFFGGSFSVLPIEENGSLGPPVSTVKHTGSSIVPYRQAGPHPHGVLFDQAARLCFVCDLGIDQILAYRFDASTGKLDSKPAAAYEIAPGSGPRLMVVHPSQRFAYVVNEISSTVCAFAREPSGKLTLVQVTSTLPPEVAKENFAAHIALDPLGSTLLISNRGHDSIASFRVDRATGRLTPVGWFESQGRVPRSFGLSPDGKWVVVANQGSNSLCTFRLDPATGLLSPASSMVPCQTPTCVTFLSHRA